MTEFHHMEQDLERRYSLASKVPVFCVRKSKRHVRKACHSLDLQGMRISPNSFGSGLSR